MKLVLGLSLFNLGTLTEAVDVLKSLPEDSMGKQALMVIAICEWRLFPVERNSQELLELFKRYPDEDLIWQDVAWIYVLAGEYRLAFDIYGKLFNIRPEVCAFLFNQVNCLRSLKREDEAKELLLSHPQCREDH